MTRRSVLLLIALLTFFGTPLQVFAIAPGSVTGTQAQAQADGSIRVQWNPAAGDIMAYRIYFSQKSILENDGYYDDVETSGGQATSYVLTGVPQNFTSVYVSVLAVNAQGEESPYFTEEVRVDRAPTQVSSPAPVSSSSAMTQEMPASSSAASTVASTLHLLSAQALSATRVGLTFSAQPVIDAAQAPSAFSIIDAQGIALPIEQLTIEGNNVAVQTMRQAAGVVYQMRLTEPLAGEGGLSLDSIDRTAFFTGHSTGLTPEEAQARAPALQQQQNASSQQQPVLPELNQQQTGGLPDVVNFRLNATPQSNQLFKITAQWEYDPATPEGAFIVVRQSRDGGRTFSAPEFLPGNLDGVEIPNVTPQYFGLAVYVADAEGHSSPGVLRSIFAWNTPEPVPAASVTQPASSSASSLSTLTPPSTPKAKSLSQTGAGAMTGLAALGAFIGWRKTRKMKKA